MPATQPTSPAGAAASLPHPSPHAAQAAKSQAPGPPSTPPAASHDERAAHRVSRKLHKKRRDGEHTPTLELPDRLKDHGNQADSEEEVLRPQAYGGGMFMNMNQSIFGLIAAAGSQADFADRFESQSSDDDDDHEGGMAKTVAGHRGLRLEPGTQWPSLARTTVLQKQRGAGDKAEGRHRRRISESRLLRSVPGLSKLAAKSRYLKSPKLTTAEEEHLPETRQPVSTTMSPTDTPPSIEITRTESRTAPVLSRMLEARAQLAARPSFELDGVSGEQSPGADNESSPTELAKQLKEIFQFDCAEEVIEGESQPPWHAVYVADSHCARQNTPAGCFRTFSSRGTCTSPLGTLPSTHTCPRRL